MSDLTPSSVSVSVHRTFNGDADSLAHLSDRDREELDKALSILKYHGATGVYLFGSMAAGEPSDHSDWDLAIEGLPSSAYLTALAELSASLSRPVDLVELDDGSRFATYLRTWEKLLHVA